MHFVAGDESGLSGSVAIERRRRSREIVPVSRRSREARPELSDRRSAVTGNRLVQFGRVILNDTAFDLSEEKAEFGADGVGGESCTEKAARDGRDPAMIERAAGMRERALQAGAHECGFVGLGEDDGERGVDMAVGDAASCAARALCESGPGDATGRAGERSRRRSVRRRGRTVLAGAR